MPTVSYSDLFGIRHEREQDESIEAGDVVRTGPNARPQFQVLAIRDDRVWVRNIDTFADGIVDVNRCRLVERRAA